LLKEKLNSEFIRIPGLTHNRIRSPRCTVYGQLE